MLGIEYILFTRGISKKEVASALSVHQSTVSVFLNGKRRLHPEYTKILQDLTGVPSEYYTRKLTTEDKIEIEEYILTELEGGVRLSVMSHSGVSY